MHEMIEKYANKILDVLEVNAKCYNVSRSDLVDMLIDTIQALEQWRSQEN